MTGLLLLRLIQCKSNTDKAVVTVACAFNNAGTIPIYFATTLFAQDPTLAARLIACVSFFSMGWSALFWTFGYGILAGSNDNEEGKRPLLNLNRSTLSKVFSPPIIGKFDISLLRPEIVAICASRTDWSSVLVPMKMEVFLLNSPLENFDYGSFHVPASFVGIVIGCIGLLSRIFVGSKPVLGGVFQAIASLGACCSPCAILVLAGSIFALPSDAGSEG